MLAHVVAQFAEESAFLWLLRDLAVESPHYRLRDLVDLDERLEANLDGLRISGEAGWRVAREELAWKEPGELFAWTSLAVASGDAARFDSGLELVPEDVRRGRGVVSALGWAEPARALPFAIRLLEHADAGARALGWRGAALLGWREPWLRAQRAPAREGAEASAWLRGAGELGIANASSVCAESLTSSDPDVRAWAAWSLTILGDRSARRQLQAVVEAGGPHADRALGLAGRALPPEESAAWFRALAANPERLRHAIVLAGAAGDPGRAEWLIEQMAAPSTARVAGEAFSLVTGADLDFEDLDRPAPSDAELGPTEDPSDENTALDRDERLPWPDPVRVADWWRVHRSRFAARQRLLCGRRIEPGSLREVLSQGRQRQRAAAALEWKLLAPEQPLFDVRANGRRQRTLLAER